MIHYKDLDHLFDHLVIDYGEYNLEKYSQELETPFAVYVKTGEDTISADGISYFKTFRIQIELVTEDIHEEIKKSIEKTFDDHDIYYSSTLDYDSDQHIYVTIYSFSVLP